MDQLDIHKLIDAICSGEEPTMFYAFCECCQDIRLFEYKFCQECGGSYELNKSTTL